MVSDENKPSLFPACKIVVCIINNLISANSQSKQEAVLFEVQFLINETKNALFNLHKWTQPEKVRLSKDAPCERYFHGSVSALMTVPFPAWKKSC